MFLAYSLSGVVVGILVGMTGVGGGALMTPILTMVFAVPSIVAVGSDLAFASITKTFGTLAHRQYGHIQWPIVKLLSLGSIPSALLTILWLKSHNGLDGSWSHSIKQTIGIAVILTVLSLLFRRYMISWLNKHPTLKIEGKPRAIATFLIGLLLGSLVTLTSIGAGAIGATLLLLLYPTLKPAEIAGTDIAYAVPLTAVAGLGHAYLGSIDWLLLSALLIGSIPGIWLGAKLTRHLPESLTRYILASVLMFTAIRMVV